MHLAAPQFSDIPDYSLPPGAQVLDGVEALQDVLVDQVGEALDERSRVRILFDGLAGVGKTTAARETRSTIHELLRSFPVEVHGDHFLICGGRPEDQGRMVENPDNYRELFSDDKGLRSVLRAACLNRPGSQVPLGEGYCRASRRRLEVPPLQLPQQDPRVVLADGVGIIGVDEPLVTDGLRDIPRIPVLLWAPVGLTVRAAQMRDYKNVKRGPERMAWRTRDVVLGALRCAPSLHRPDVIIVDNTRALLQFLADHPKEYLATEATAS